MKTLHKTKTKLLYCIRLKYKTKLLVKTETNNANGSLKNATISVPTKYFWRSLKIPLINCKVEL